MARLEGENDSMAANGGVLSNDVCGASNAAGSTDEVIGVRAGLAERVGGLGSDLEWAHTLR